jgi:hypothetical protein
MDGVEKIKSEKKLLNEIEFSGAQTEALAVIEMESL